MLPAPSTVTPVGSEKYWLEELIGIALEDTSVSWPVVGSTFSTPPHPWLQLPPIPNVLIEMMLPAASKASANGALNSWLDALIGIVLADSSLSAPVAGSTVIRPPHPGTQFPNARPSTTTSCPGASAALAGAASTRNASAPARSPRISALLQRLLEGDAQWHADCGTQGHRGQPDE